MFWQKWRFNKNLYISHWTSHQWWKILLVRKHWNWHWNRRITHLHYVWIFQAAEAAQTTSVVVYGERLGDIFGEFHKFGWIFEFMYNIYKYEPNWENSRASRPAYPLWKLVVQLYNDDPKHKIKQRTCCLTQASQVKTERLAPSPIGSTSND